MTDKERELIDAGVEYARSAKHVLLGAEDAHVTVLAARVLEASTAVLDERLARAEAPEPEPVRRMPIAGEVLPSAQRASWCRSEEP